MKTFYSLLLIALLFPLTAFAQVNSGSDGHDGALNPASNLVIDMADHPDGIYQYTSVNVPAGVTVSFIPNAGNKPVVWLAQGDCVINGAINVFGQSPNSGIGAVGGPGGYRGGNGGNAPTSGQGPGSGLPGAYGGFASFGNLGSANDFNSPSIPPGQTYGNTFLVPLLGGSGGGGGDQVNSGGGGGGGAILIAASGQFTLAGNINANGGAGALAFVPNRGYIDCEGGGSGGAVRLIASKIVGTGSISASGGGYGGGKGRVRFDCFDTSFGGTITGVFTQGFQPIILPAPGQGIQLDIQSVGGAAVPGNPSGVLANPDVIIPAQQSNPISVVVRCTNIPLNTEVAVVVHPANGSDVQAVGINNTGTAASSTATVSLNMPRGGGIIYSKAVTGINGGNAAASASKDSKTASYAQTGLTTDGERFANVETKAILGGKQETTLITASGKRFAQPGN